MNLELLKGFYDRAIAKCDKNDAWLFEQYFAEEVAEYCASVCEEMGTKVAGCDGGKPTRIADDCAAWIRKDFGL